MSRLHRHLSYANVVASLALFLALGGTSYAALVITSKNVKNGSLTGKDIKNASVASADIKNNSLLVKDFKPGQLPVGVPGPQGGPGPSGPAGPQGPTGPAGTPGTDAFGSITYVKGPNTTLPANQWAVVVAVADCPAGQVPLGGGVSTLSDFYTQIAWSRPRFSAGAPVGWESAVSHRSGYSYGYVVNAWVACAKAGSVTGP